MEEWKEYKYTEIAALIGGGTPKTSNPAYWGGNIPWLSVKDFGNDAKYVYKTEKTITEEGLNNSSTKLLQKDDIIISARGTIGEMAMIPFPMSFNQSCFGIRGYDIIDKDYLYYLTKTKVNELKNNAHGCVFDTITRATFENIICSIPPLPTQQKIASILSSLDDKIEVNRRINEQLEELAQALFKSWFVDFEPFKDGEFVESELGMIPEGWKVGTLGEVCNKITDGSHYSPKDNPKSNIPMLSVKDMQKYSFDYSKAKHIDEEEFAKMKSNDCVPLVNDILVAKDGSYLKEIFICKNEIKQAILSSIAIFRANKSIIYPIVLLCVLKSPRTLKNVSENYVSGSALPRIVLKDFKRYNIIIPPIDCQERFNDIISSIYDKIYANEEEITHLTNLRDTLLPKLMSGEIGVNDVEL